jgi:hypothetical protein
MFTRGPKLHTSNIANRMMFCFLCGLMALLEWPSLLRLEQCLGIKCGSLTYQLDRAEQEQDSCI